MQYTAEEVVEPVRQGRCLRPSSAMAQLLPTFAQLVEREAFVPQPGAGFVRPRAPFRFSARAPTGR